MLVRQRQRQRQRQLQLQLQHLHLRQLQLRQRRHQRRHQRRQQQRWRKSCVDSSYGEGRSTALWLPFVVVVVVVFFFWAALSIAIYIITTFIFIVVWAIINITIVIRAVVANVDFVDSGVVASPCRAFFSIFCAAFDFAGADPPHGVRRGLLRAGWRGLRHCGRRLHSDRRDRRCH
jgi:ABC-type multidrug transport system fused ATPase/permease subunit